MHYSRRERRNIAKQLGLLGKKETHKQWSERTSRSHEAGRQIHTQFVQDVENNLRNQQIEKDASMAKNLLEGGIPQDKVDNILNNNRLIELKRQNDLIRRENKRLEKRKKK